MLGLLRHPRVVQLHAVISSESLGWGLVMDAYKSGTVDTVVQAHWHALGQLALPGIQNVTRMMVEATAWLHSLSIVHRDLKQTNFLVDRGDITDPEIQVVLCDVATAVRLSEGQRKKRQAGTKLFRAPEVWRRNYGLSADVWALGVITFTLLFKRWPFNNAKQACLKE